MSASPSVTSRPPWPRRLAVALFFVLLLGVGLAVFRDYGVSWDEVNNHLNGLVNLKYVVQTLAPQLARQPAFNRSWIPDIHVYRDRDHGAAFEMLTTVLGQVVARDDSRPFYFFRHLCVFLTFTAGVWALYRIGQLRFGRWPLALAAAAALVVSPRFFAEAFYNGKDIVYMALFTLAVYTLVRLLRRPTLARAGWHALATAAAIDVRAQGLQLVVLSLLMMALEARFAQPETSPVLPVLPRHWGRAALVYVAATLVLAFVGWPYLWAASWADLLHFSERLRAYRWTHSVLYLGQFIPARHVPWHYIPVWVLITTPLAYTLAAVGGVVAAFRGLLQRGALRDRAARLDVLLLLWLLAPWLFVVAFGSTLYDGWRHLYFVYPALLLMAVRGAQALWAAAKARPRWRKVAVGLGIVAAAEVGHTVVRMVQLHPFQNVYFSCVPAATAERLFERDYWALSYRQGLEWILAHDASPRVAVAAPRYAPFYNNTLILPPAERNRLQFMPRESNSYRYFITGYRWHPQSYADSVGQEVHAIRAGGLKVLSVFRR
ncbi:hypothetical protein F0P96_17415 [Hymenobacter busanensis]|uniref:Uncharacterized protein n=1 Tax=Hymenobacter busanensis TaxID=2607656 RepID=A0A7L5A2V3_9BACT|nr:hypothetical protein [Hymenobacter busanensis]KAA9327025.1 hypothetical protein F0P96_17415 [Hymenobacter busanensis]QHJ09476.1 hypothetical protein GUY19_20230 [Hymenobacter busanensis]